MSLVKKFNRLNVSVLQKIVSLIFLIPIIYLLFYSLLGYNGYIDFAQKEIRGCEILLKLKPVLISVSEQRLTLNQNDNMKVNNCFQGLIESFNKYQTELSLTDAYLEKNQKSSLNPTAIYKKWKVLSSKDLMKKDEFDIIISDLLSLNSMIGDVSNLILDPDLDSYYLMDVALLAMPQTVTRMFDVKYYIINNIDSNTINFNNRVYLSVFHSTFKQSDKDRINVSISTALEQDEKFYAKSETLKQNIDSYFDKFNKNGDALLESTINASTIEKPIFINDISESINVTLNSSYLLWNNSLTELIELLKIRIDSYNSDRVRTVVIAIICVLVAYFIQYLVTRNISQLINGVIQFLNYTASGDCNYSAQK